MVQLFDQNNAKAHISQFKIVIVRSVRDLSYEDIFET